jgi:predicted membrane-bound spermidine synthase
MKAVKSLYLGAVRMPFTFFLLVTAFFEGGAVMATEVLAAKLIAPWYGNSIYVWAGVLGITLAGLAAGYFTGSWLSGKPRKEKKLFAFLLCGALLLGLLPITTETLVASTLGMELRAGITISCFMLLFFPLLCFGTVSPLIISCLSSRSNAGRTTGNVYAVSTIGGIVFTFVTVFGLIPGMGLAYTAYAVSIATLLFPIYFFMKGSGSFE